MNIKITESNHFNINLALSSFTFAIPRNQIMLATKFNTVKNWNIFMKQFLIEFLFNFEFWRNVEKKRVECHLQNIKSVKARKPSPFNSQNSDMKNVASPIFIANPIYPTVFPTVFHVKQPLNRSILNESILHNKKLINCLIWKQTIFFRFFSSFQSIVNNKHSQISIDFSEEWSLATKFKKSLSSRSKQIGASIHHSIQLE